jgi:hypothetical protein
MLNNSSPGQTVYEPFLGSGTTLIATETCGRSCLGLELSPTYVDVAIKRWQEFTGSTAVHAHGGSFAEIAQQRGVLIEQNPKGISDERDPGGRVKIGSFRRFRTRLAAIGRK